MPRVGWVRPRADQRLSDHLSIGVLTSVFPPDLVDEVIESTSCVEQRSRLMPARLTTYFVLALTLFRSEGYVDVVRQLVAGLEWASGWRGKWHVPSSPGLSKARTRLGPGAVEELFKRTAGPVKCGSLVGGLIPVAVDGTVLDIPDTSANEHYFGRPPNRNDSPSAYPQARVVALAQCSTHGMLAASVGPLRNGEQTLVRDLFGALDQTMMLLADRLFFSFSLWEQALATGAGLCWRMKQNSVLPVRQVLSDGSYRSRIYPDANSRRRDTGGIDVRVVEYQVGDNPETIRLITSITDPATASAEQIAQAYRHRWHIETSFDELKTHQGGSGLVLRSKTPGMVLQEIWSFLCVHLAIRRIIADTAINAGRDPTEASFTAALRSARLTVVTHPGFSPHSP